MNYLTTDFKYSPRKADEAVARFCRGLLITIALALLVCSILVRL